VPVTFRPIGPDEVDLFLSFADASPLGIKPPPAAYRDGLDRWYRPDWSWVALRDGAVVARVAFSGPLDQPRPFAMGSLEIGTGPDRVGTGLGLVRAAFAAYGPVSWRQFVPVGWSGDPVLAAAVADRVAVATGVGLEFLVERLDLRWPGGPVPARRGRLSFRPVPDRDALLPVVAGTVTGTLDATMRADVAARGLDAAVRSFVDQLAEPVSLWRLGYLDDECVGVVAPGNGPFGPDIGYVGVLPAHRGHGYADELLTEGTRLLVEAEVDVDDIAAMTDIGNGPMAAAFARCGWVVREQMLVYTPA
jgi:GNAT superfamily N-acetyltransferase